jgi:mRNA interferase MazF
MFSSMDTVFSSVLIRNPSSPALFGKELLYLNYTPKSPEKQPTSHLFTNCSKVNTTQGGFPFMGRKNKNARPVYRRRIMFHPERTMKRSSAGEGRSTSSAAPNSGGSGSLLITAISPALRSPRRGDIWFADLGKHPGTSVQSGCRPVLIVSNDEGNAHSDTINVVPMTSQIKKLNLPCHVRITPDMVSDAHQPFWVSMTLAEQITTISRYALRTYVGRLEDKKVLTAVNCSIAEQLELLPGQRFNSVTVPKWEERKAATMTVEEGSANEC